MGGLPLLLIVLLSTLGVAYSAWRDTVVIEGTVKMGSLTLAFDWEEPPECHEYYRDPLTGKLIKGEYGGKDVGSCDAWYEDEIQDPHTGKKGFKRLVISITNAYPHYIVHTTFLLHNIGTIPLCVKGYNITGEKRDSTGAKVYDLLWYDPDGDYIGSLYEDVNGNGVVDDGDIEVINLEITNEVGWRYQIDPCRTHKAEMDLEFKQEAEECHTYIITVEVIAIQWNKVEEEEPPSPPPPCEWKWVSPKEWVDNGTDGSRWEYEGNIADDDTGTTALGLADEGVVWIANLTLKLGSAMKCKGIRFFVNDYEGLGGANVTRVFVFDVDLNKWVKVYDREFYNNTWNTVMFSEMNVSKACIAFKGSADYISEVFVGEFDFYVCEESQAV